MQRRSAPACRSASRQDVTYIGLVLNKRGALRALETQVHELGAVISASDGFGTRNQGRTADETVEDAIEIIRLAKEHGRSAQATISVAFGCPFDGEIAPSRVAELARRWPPQGLARSPLGDTIGVAVPSQVKTVMAAVKRAAPGIPIRLHFHDTRNTAVANAWAGFEAGAATLDASIGGIGGCPFAPNATGNVATEDVQYMLQRSGVETGPDARWADRDRADGSRQKWAARCRASSAAPEAFRNEWPAPWACASSRWAR